MPFSFIEGALGGIGLFLLGMRLLSDGIRTVADVRIRRFFSKCTSNRFNSLLFGVVMSFLVNSGSASFIFTIGLINGGVLNSFQAMSVLGGVLIGSSLSLHFPIIPYNLIATPLIFSGVVFKFFAHRRRLANIGDLLLGMGLLFLGLTLLEGSYRPIQNHPLYEAFNDVFYHVPLLAALFGALVSFLVQSASSTVSIVTSLLHSHQVVVSLAADMIAGGLIGVAAIGCLASVGGACIARRVGLVFLSISICVAALFLVSSPLLVSALPAVSKGASSNNSGNLYHLLAWVHTAASLSIALLAVVLSGPASRLLATMELSKKCGLDSAESSAGYLDARILNTPTIAIEQARKEIIRMMSVTSFMYADIREIVFEFDARRAETIRQHEKVLDSLNHEITAFLALLSRSTKNPEINYETPGLLQTVSALEHIGDRCEEVLDIIVVRKNDGITFSNEAMRDLKIMIDAVGDVIVSTEEVVKKGQPYGADALHALKRSTRNHFDIVKQAHFDRISSGICSPQALMIFNDLTTALGAMAEICWSVLGKQIRRSNEQ
jgi:phosphate:Na+ symporter